MIAAIIEKRNYLHFLSAARNGEVSISNIKPTRLGSTNPPIPTYGLALSRFISFNPETHLSILLYNCHL